MEFCITNRKGVSFSVLVDECDRVLIEKYTWHVFNEKTPYPRATVKKEDGSFELLFLHRIILNISDPKVFADHINGNKLDNRRCNLRLSTHLQNTKNRKSYENSTSEYVGVSWHKHASKWRAMIKSKHLGYFDTQEDAAKAYDKAAKEIHGEFANLNFP